MSEKMKTVVWSLVLAGLLVLCSVSWGAVISLTGDASGMTLKSGDTLKLNGHTVNGQVTVAGGEGPTLIQGPGRVRVGAGLKQKGIRLHNVTDGRPSNNVTIEGVTISADSISAVGERGIEALWDVKGLTIRDVTIENIMVPIMLRRTNGLTVEYCLLGPNNVTDSGQHCEALSDCDSDNVTIRFNVFKDFMNSGTVVSGNGWSTSGGTAENWNIHDNVFYYTGRGVAWGVGNGIVACYNGQPAVNWRVERNTAVNMQGWQAGVVLLNPRGCVVADNVWYLLGKDPKGGPTALTQMDQLWTGADPFVDWRGGDFGIKEAALAGKGARWPFVGDVGPVETPKPEPTATPVAERPVLVLYDAQRARVGRILGDEWMQVGFEEGEYSVAAEPGAGVSRVRFYVDGALVNEEGAVPYMLGGDWVTRYWAPGEYEIGVSYLASAGWGEVMAETLGVMPKAVVTPEPTAEPTPEPTATPGPVDCAEVEARLALALAANEALTRRVAEVEGEKAVVEERLGEVEAERDALRGVVEAVKAAVGGGT